MVGACGVDGVSAAGTDSQHTDAVPVDTGYALECIDRVGDVLAAPIRVFQIPRRAPAFALICRIEHQGRDTPVGQPRRIVGTDLFLHAAARRREHDRRARTLVVREVQDAREVERPAGDAQRSGRHGGPPFDRVHPV